MYEESGQRVSMFGVSWRMGVGNPSETERKVSGKYSRFVGRKTADQ